MHFSNHIFARRVAVLVALGLIIICNSGCGGGGGGGGGGAPQAGAGTEVPSYLFVADGESSVSLFVADADTGELAFDGYLMSGVSSTGAVAVHPNGKFVFVLGGGKIASKAFNAEDGTWTQVGRYDTGANPREILISDDGQNIYVNNVNDDSISSYSVDTDSGELTELGTVSTGDGPLDIVMHPTGDFLYSVNTHSREVSRFMVAADGTLGSEWVVLTASFDVHGLAFLPNGEHAILSLGTSNNNIYELDVDTSNGALTTVNQKSAGSQPSSIVVNSAGDLAFVINQSSSSVTRFRIDAFGELSSPSNYDTGTDPRSISFGPEEKTLFVGSTNEHQVTSFRITSSGALATTDSVRPRGGAFGLATRAGVGSVSTATEFAYVPLSGNDEVVVYGRDSSTGNLSEVSSTSAGAAVRHLVLHPKMSVAYAVSSDSSEVEVYGVDQSTGALSSWQVLNLNVDGNENWIRLAVDPSGQFLYALDNRQTLGNGGRIQAFNISSEGMLSFASSVNTGNNPENIEISPNGRNLLCMNSYGDSVHVYEINESNGTLSPRQTLSGIDRPLQAAFHPSGNWVYITAQNENLVYRFIVRANGTLDNSQYYATPMPTQTKAVAAHPDGNSLYMTSADGSLAHFSIDEFGRLDYESQVAANFALWIRISHDGRHAYLAAQSEVLWFDLEDNTGTPSYSDTIETPGLAGHQKTLTID